MTSSRIKTKRLAKIERRKLIATIERIRAFANRADNVGDPPYRTGRWLAHRRDGMFDLVHRRTDQIVHCRVDNDNLGMTVFHIDNLRDKDATGAYQVAAWLEF